MTDEHTETTERTRISEIACEMRSKQLLETLKDAVAGAPHWRHAAQDLLRAIAAGEPPEPPRW
jgi:hypothetical protein